jgi:hypothetical protein
MKHASWHAMEPSSQWRQPDRQKPRLHPGTSPFQAFSKSRWRVGFLIGRRAVERGFHAAPSQGKASHAMWPEVSMNSSRARFGRANVHPVLQLIPLLSQTIESGKGRGSRHGIVQHRWIRKRCGSRGIKQAAPGNGFDELIFPRRFAGRRIHISQVGRTAIQSDHSENYHNQPRPEIRLLRCPRMRVDWWLGDSRGHSSLLVANRFASGKTLERGERGGVCDKIVRISVVELPKTPR